MGVFGDAINSSFILNKIFEKQGTCSVLVAHVLQPVAARP